MGGRAGSTAAVRGDPPRGARGSVPLMTPGPAASVGPRPAGRSVAPRTGPG